MNYQQARIFCITAVIILVLLLLNGLRSCIFSPDEPETTPAPTEQPADTAKVDAEPVKALQISKRVGNLARQFADLNPAHLAAARRIGIKPIHSTADILKISRPIQRVKSCDNYSIDKLTHSYPYLVPEAAALLDSIGGRFRAKLAAQDGGDYRIIVTSLLRTSESVNRLQRRNVNSTDNSAHLYGTTFDISYVDFSRSLFSSKWHGDGELKNLLAEVLLELRDEGLCLVKFERKQGCFHITATGGN